MGDDGLSETTSIIVRPEHAERRRGCAVQQRGFAGAALSI